MKSDNWHILGCPSVLVFLCAAFPNLAHSFLATPVKATLSRVLYSWTTLYFPFIVRKVRRKHLMDHYSYIKWRPVLKPPGFAPLKSKLAVGNWLSAITVRILIAVWVHQPSTSDAIFQEKMNHPPPPWRSPSSAWNTKDSSTTYVGALIANTTLGIQRRVPPSSCTTTPTWSKWTALIAQWILLGSKECPALVE